MTVPSPPHRNGNVNNVCYRLMVAHFSSGTKNTFYEGHALFFFFFLSWVR